MEILKSTIDKILSRGADKAQLVLSENQKREFNIESDEFSLLRTNLTKNLSLRVIKNNKQGRISVNKIDEKSINEAIEEVFQLCEASPADESYDISTSKGDFRFSSGSKKADADVVYDRMQELMTESQTVFPKVKMESVCISHDFNKTQMLNSNGVQADIESGRYQVSNMFTAKDGEKTSSFNYVGFAADQLKQPLIEEVGLRQLLAESEMHLEARPINQKFVGDVIVTPYALGGFFLGTLLGHLHDSRLIDKTSFFKDSIGRTVLSEKLSLWAMSDSPLLATKSYMTSDGFPAQDYSVFEKGQLKTFLLSQYGANKTGLKQTFNDGGLIVMDAGETELDQMIKTTKKGIVLSRISAGSPGANGDFSGVAKNSFYVEDGQIKFPIKETMISGNIFEMFKSMPEVSKETLNDGQSICPWVKFSDVSITG